MKGDARRASGQERSPLQVARETLSGARSVRAEVEAYVEYGRTVTIKVFSREVESITVAEPRGLGVRAIQEGRTGYAFTSDLSGDGIHRVVQAAADNMKAADADESARLPVASGDGYPALSDLWRPGVAGTPLSSKVDMALAAEAAALSLADIETVEESVYSDEETLVGIASTTGVEIEAEQSYCWAYVMAHAGGEGDRQSGLGFSAGREPGELEAEQAGREAAEKARALLGARPCPTGSYTVVLDREVVAALLSGLVRALSADAVQKGRSVFTGRVGDTLAAPLVSLVDDGLAAGGMATRPFDGEGVPQRTTSLIEGGVLKSFLHSTYTACKAGGETLSTGNAGRGSYRALPSVSATNLVVGAGDGKLQDLFARVGRGLYVDSIAGLHSGLNAITGEISVGATGRLIADGSIGAPVREVTIATDFAGLLSGVIDLAGDARWVPLYGSVYAPSVAVRGVTVSGS